MASLTVHVFSILATLSVLALTSDAQAATGNKVVMCYVIQWSVYRRPQGTFAMEDIDPALCTHLVYAYVGMDGNTYRIKSRDENGESDEGKKGLITKIIELKERNPSLKVLVSVGGWMEGSVKYSNMVSKRQNRAAFISSLVSYMKNHKFDGMDLGWYYPGDRGGKITDRENLILLLKELKARFRNLGYKLTMQVDGRRYMIIKGYDVGQISKYVDYINLLTFQYKTPWDYKTGPNAPLNSTDDLNVDFAVNYLIENGAKPQKILLGMATYGHPFQVKDDIDLDERTDFMSLPTGKIIQGKWSAEEGFIGFNEVCDDLTNGNGWQEHWDEPSSTPYAIKGKVFYSYDNARSFKEKLKLLFRKRLGGAMVMSLDTDDFSGRCYGKKYPLVGTIASFFRVNRNRNPLDAAFAAGVSDDGAEPEDRIRSNEPKAEPSPPTEPDEEKTTERVPRFSVAVVSHHMDI